MGLQTFIEVSFQKEGVHVYPDALINPKLKDVAYLGYLHRHMFHFYVKMEVFHLDRDVEFIMLKRELEKMYGDGALALDYKSCEMIADELLVYLMMQYPFRDMTIRVYEDDENGAVLEYTK